MTPWAHELALGLPLAPAIAALMQEAAITPHPPKST
jgi:hypothetical protein